MGFFTKRFICLLYISLLKFVLTLDDIYLWLQVRKRPLNKKELAKNEEDIIDTHSNSLTVHETKLKVEITNCFIVHSLLTIYVFLMFMYKYWNLDSF